MIDLTPIYTKIMACVYDKPQLVADIDTDLLNNQQHVEIVKTLQAHLESNPKLTTSQATEIVAFECPSCELEDRSITTYRTRNFADYSVSDFDTYINRIKRQRHVEASIKITAEALNKMAEPTANPLLLLTEALENIKANATAYDEQSAAASVKELLESGEYEAFVNSSANKIPTQFPILNRMLNGGFAVGHLVTIAAKPSSGKTELMLEMAEHIAYKEKRHVLYFTMEMGKCEIVTRLVQSRGSVSYRDMERTNGEYANAAAVDKRFDQLKAANTYHIIDGIRQTKRIITEIRKAHKQGRCDICFIDYIGLMNPDSEQKDAARYLELGRMSAALKDLADTLQIPIVIAQQYDRKAEGMPTMGNIRESGDIAANSSEVMLIYNPIFDKNASFDDWGNHIAVNLDKNREGDRGCLILTHNGQCKNIQEETNFEIKQKLVELLDKQTK